MPVTSSESALRPAAAQQAANPYWLQAIVNDREEAERLLCQGGRPQVSQALRILQQPEQDPLVCSDWRAGVAVCQALLATSVADWTALLQEASALGSQAPLKAPQASGPETPAKTLRQQVRRVSLLVHPDKCNWPRAEQAFQALQDQVATLVYHLPGEDGGAEGAGSGDPSAWRQEWAEDMTGNVYDRWHDDPQPAAKHTASTRASEADSVAEKDRAHLASLTPEDLKAVVIERQSLAMQKMRSPQGPGNLTELQGSLRRARTALSQTQHHDAARKTPAGGFFAAPW